MSIGGRTLDCLVEELMFKLQQYKKKLIESKSEILSSFVDRIPLTNLRKIVM